MDKNNNQKVYKALAIREKIKSVEQIGNFEDEYVYDISRKGDRHTFIANNILVHNSLFVSFKPAIDHCDWMNLYLNTEYLNSIDKKFIIVWGYNKVEFDNPNCVDTFESLKSDDDKILVKDAYNDNEVELIIIDGRWIINKDIIEYISDINVLWNWSRPLDFVIGIDKMKYGQYFADSLSYHASKYNVENRQEFELEKISDSIINIAKKKYIQNNVYEDGRIYDNLSYIISKGVELVRSSTPSFARERIPEIVKYLFTNPDTFQISELVKMVKKMKSEFVLCYPDKVDDIAMQTSCSAYNEKIINDKTDLVFENGTHFGVRSAGLHNHLLYQNKDMYLGKYSYIKAGEKIKFMCIKHEKKSKIKYFGYIRGAYPIEFAPDVDLDTHFQKSILSPINSIIKPLGLPLINERLSVLMDIFADSAIEFNDVEENHITMEDNDGFDEEMGIFYEDEEKIIVE